MECETLLLMLQGFLDGRKVGTRAMTGSLQEPRLIVASASLEVGG
jgi:hypothetical protein